MISDEARLVSALGENTALENWDIVRNRVVATDPGTLIEFSGTATLRNINIVDNEMGSVFERAVTETEIDAAYINIVDGVSVGDLFESDAGVLTPESRSDIGAYGGPLGASWAP